MIRKNRRKTKIFVAAVCLMTVTLAGCGKSADMQDGSERPMESGSVIAGDSDGQTGAGQGGLTGPGIGTGGQTAAENAAPENLILVGEMFTDRDRIGEYKETECVKISLKGDTAQCDDKEVSISGGVVTIRAAGTYLLTGELKDGMILVEADKSAKVQLVLGGASIVNNSGAAIYVKSADKVFLTLAEETENALENGGSYQAIDDNKVDAVIFAKSDLVVNGTGSLSVTAKAGHGIVSKDDLKIMSGSLFVTAEGHGLCGKDSVRIAGGTVEIVSGKDGIRSDNEKKEDKGYIYIADGTFTINAGGDGISASGQLQIDGGSFEITAGRGSKNKTAARDDNGDTVSTKGIKTAGNLVINAGNFSLDTQDDALHANKNLTVNGGEFQIATGDDGLHADETTTVAGGKIEITASYEGIEGNDIVISGGLIDLYATDDGLNAAGGRDQSGFGGMFGGMFGGRGDKFGGGGFGESGSCSVLISGGTIYVNAGGDGLDSNGTLTVTGGTVYVDGPVNGGNGALDFDGTGEITGGTVIAVGAAGMAQNFSKAANQGSVYLNVGNRQAGTEIALKDKDGKVLCSHTAKKTFATVVISCPGLVQGETYTVSVGENDVTVTMDSFIYGNGDSFGGFGGPGGMGGFGRPGGMGGFGGEQGGFGGEQGGFGGDWSGFGGEQGGFGGDWSGFGGEQSGFGGEQGGRNGERQNPGGVRPGAGEMPQMPQGER